METKYLRRGIYLSVIALILQLIGGYLLKSSSIGLFIAGIWATIFAVIALFLLLRCILIKRNP